MTSLCAPTSRSSVLLSCHPTRVAAQPCCIAAVLAGAEQLAADVAGTPLILSTTAVAGLSQSAQVTWPVCG